jgi:predicted secreted protein
MAIKTFTVANVKLNGTAGTAIGNLDSAALTVSMDNAECTAFGDSWKKYLTLAKGWTLTVNAKYDYQDLGATSLRTEFVTGDCVVTSVTMYETASCYFSGDTIVTNYSENVAVGSPDTFSVTFMGNGTLGYTAG